MTREQWRALTPEQQQLKVAELTGWEIARNEDIAGWAGTTICIGYHVEYGKDLVVVPDYLNDLNAMHEAEKLLNHNDHDRIGDYTGNLTQVMGAFNASWMWTFATAAQRAEAFVLTMDTETKVSRVTKGAKAIG